jgi:uncharacterized protein
MDIEVAKAAIDLVIDNARQLNSKTAKMSFHGGGEPTLAWSLIQKSVEYSQKMATENGVRLHITLTTNGLLSETQRNWIVANIGHVQVSFDGPPDIQNSQRPKIGGRPSFQDILDTIQHFERKDFSFGIQAVITPASVHRMPELIEFFMSISKVRQLHFEPLFECGRCMYSGWKSPSAEEFAMHFIQAWKFAASHSIRLVCSLSRLQTLTPTFCGAAGRNFFVTPNGNLTACLEVSIPNEDTAETFIYGEYDYSTKKFKIDVEKLTFLASRNIYNMSSCMKCAFKWHCGGDCLVKSLVSGSLFDPTNTERCKLSKLITLGLLEEVLDDPALSSMAGVRLQNL